RMIAEMVREGKPPVEIATRMKEALSQIRHSKSDRPVFTPEFLSRLKRVIVFNALDAAAMTNISRHQFTELRKTWSEKRHKRLDVPPELLEYVGEQAHRFNEKSGGQEGGRIVRKLITDWVESRLQREASLRPKEYRLCKSVALGFITPTFPSGDESPP